MKSFVTMNGQTITGILLQYINFGTFVFSFLCQTLSKICAWVFVYALLGCSFPYFLYSHLLQLSFFFFFPVSKNLSFSCTPLTFLLPATETTQPVS